MNNQIANLIQESMKNNHTHENKIHGTLSFPYIVYRGNIPEYISSFPLHWHEEFEIIYIVRGKGIITIQTQKYECMVGDLFLIPPHLLHSIEQYQNEHMEYFNILFKLSLLEENPHSLCNMNYFFPLTNQEKQIPIHVPANMELNRNMLPYIKYLVEHRKDRESGYELFIKSNLFALMYHINKYVYTTPEHEIARNETIDKIKNILIYVKDHYFEDIKVQQAADICGFSVSHFMKLFRQVTGLSFTQYLITYRLEVAAKELITSKTKIIDISENVGFHNFSYFIRSFQKKYGQSPSAYRKTKTPLKQKS